MYVSMYMLFVFLLDQKKRWPNAPPDAVPALRRTPRVGEVGLTVDGSSTKDRCDDNLYKDNKN
jgi:hypothetical protein